MFVPPFPAILQALGLDKTAFDGRDTIELPRTLFDLLIRCALMSTRFSETDYLADFPDVHDAIRAGQARSGKNHYLLYGYFEGRLTGVARVDEDWYLREYPDVAEALRNGQINSAEEHYRAAGLYEWRSPNAEARRDIELWKRALRVA